MKTTGLVLSLGCALLVLGCSPTAPGAGGTEKRLKALEDKVGTLQAQNSDLRAKLRTTHGFGRSPLADFFASPEFWQCTYDSSWSDCSSRCAKNKSPSDTICAAKPTPEERLACFQQGSDNVAACVQACPVQTSPTDPPSCRTGGPA